MAGPTQKSSKSSLPVQLSELREMVVAYAKQETIEPLKQLGRFVGFGVAGSLLICISGVLLTLGSLRLLQEETGDLFDGNFTWAPYLIVMVGTAVAAALAGRAITRSTTPGDD